MKQQSLIEDLLGLRLALADLEDEPGSVSEYALGLIRDIALEHGDLAQRLQSQRQRLLTENGWREIWVPVDFEGCWYVMPLPGYRTKPDCHHEPSPDAPNPPRFSG